MYFPEINESLEVTKINFTNIEYKGCPCVDMLIEYINPSTSKKARYTNVMVQEMFNEPGIRNAYIANELKRSVKITELL